MKYLNIYIVVMLFASFASCKNQGQSVRMDGGVVDTDLVLIDSVTAIRTLDTVWTSYAPSRITRKIRKGQNGDLLFAAFTDIIRYDGASFTRLAKEERLDSFDAFDVLEDRNGNIWVASTHLGVFRYPASSEAKSEGKASFRFTTENGLIHNRTMCLYEDMTGGIWIGTEGGISYYDGESSMNTQSHLRNFTTEGGLADRSVNAILEDKTGKIWVGTRGTLSVYDPQESPKSGEITFSTITNDDGKSFQNIWSIMEDRNGNIWLGGQYGLWRYDGDSFTSIATNSVMCVYEDKEGNVWVSHETGLSRYDQKALVDSEPKPTPIYIGGGMFFGITEDKDGAIWVGTLNAALRYDGKSVTYFGNKE